MPHISTLLIWCVENNSSYFNLTYLVCQDECLICELDLFGVPRRIPHILTFFIWYAEKNASYLTLLIWYAEKNA